MTALERKVFAALTSAGLALCGTAGAAAAPAALTDGQLDGVTAGGVSLISSADAGAVGAFTMGGTATSTVAGASAVPGQPGLESGAGLADGSAVAVGTNFGSSGPPASTSTNVQTAGAASGTMVINSTVNETIHGAGGVTMQVGWTFVFGAYGTL